MTSATFDITAFTGLHEGQHFDRKSLFQGPEGKKVPRDRKTVRGDTGWLAGLGDIDLSDRDVRALLEVRRHGQIDNSRLREMTGLDTLAASQMLRHLRDIKMLQPRSGGRRPTTSREMPFPWLELRPRIPAKRISSRMKRMSSPAKRTSSRMKRISSPAKRMSRRANRMGSRLPSERESRPLVSAPIQKNCEMLYRPCVQCSRVALLN